jgi:Tfp pilus assembly protein PilO
MEADATWHLDKRVPIALIVTIAIQTAGIVWWAANVSSRIERLEEKTAVVAPQTERLTRVEVQLEVVKEGVTEIKRLLQARPHSAR